MRKLIWVLIVGLVIGLSISTISTERSSKEPAISTEIAQLNCVLEIYYSDTGAYPEDEPDFSSRALVNALQPADPNKKVYYPFIPGRIKNGEYYSHLGHPYFYRENHSEEKKTPDMHNPDSFDIWTKNLKGKEDGLNNWGTSDLGTSDLEAPQRYKRYKLDAIWLVGGVVLIVFLVIGLFWLLEKRRRSTAARSCQDRNDKQDKDEGNGE